MLYLTTRGGIFESLGVMRITKDRCAKLWGPPIPSPPLCEEVRRHKVSGRGQTVLSPQTQVGLGDNRGWSRLQSTQTQGHWTLDSCKSNQCQVRGVPQAVIQG